MSEEDKKYLAYSKMMEEKYPEMFGGKYGGFAIGEGWWGIVEKLCDRIQSHIKWNNQNRERFLKDNPHDHPIPEFIPPVEVQQIKEKFGGLRFYYEGGDEYVRGLVSMAEAWADASCEVCGAPGTRRHGGWVRTLCDTHERERQQRIEEQARKDGLEL